jgi:hypothetical protein
MNTQRSFGRRTVFQRQPLRATPKLDLPAPEPKLVVADAPADPAALLRKEIILPPADGEWRERERPIKPKVKIPWRQVALMATLCFGVASLVLPDSISDDLDWLLYGLMAISAYAGFSKRVFQS